MKRLVLLIALLLVASTAGAVKIRRPYAPHIARNYGFDNNGAAGGCTDYMCKGACYHTHTGTDFPIPLGTDVLAGAEGKVVAVFNGCPNYGYAGNPCGSYCGNYVKIRHPDGDDTLYCHMLKDAFTVKVGDAVACGQKIGKSASSGSSTGPHLHLSVAPGGGKHVDSYAGPCSSSKGYWIDPATYGAPPGATCACSPKAEVCNGVDDDCDGAVDEDGVCCKPGTEVCNGKDDDCDGRVDEDEVCEIDELLRTPEAYAPSRTTDVDGDGKADVCGRGSRGLWCHLSKGDSFSEPSETAPLSDANGWNDLRYSSTLRFGDVDGDGRADFCARAIEGVYCFRSLGDGSFASPPIEGPRWSDANGWIAPKHFTTFRLADVDGDGKDDLCARTIAGLLCARSTGSGFGEPFEGPPWSDANGFASVKYYGTIRMADVDGDGKADACVRNKDAVECHLSNGAGFDRKIEGPSMKDSDGWGDPSHWSTIRLVDVNGDRKADLCARDVLGYFCHFSTGVGFGPQVRVAEWSNANGWNDAAKHRTIRAADVDGDGAADLCARGSSGVECFRFDGSAFVRIEGPKLDDANGWNAIQFHGTLLFGDATGDGRADLFGRAIAGGQVWPSTGAGFGDSIDVSEFKDEGGWNDVKYWSTLRFGGPPRRPTPVPPTPVDDAGPAEDAASPPDSATDRASPDGDLEGACSCRTTIAGPPPWSAIVAILLLGRRTRRRRGG